jgi:hypothetical protein
MTMPEIKTPDNNAPPASGAPAAPAAGTPAMPDQPQKFHPVKAPVSALGDDNAAAAPAAAETKPIAMPPERAPYPVKPKITWVHLFFGSLLIVALVILSIRPRHRQSLINSPNEPKISEEKQDLDNYSAFIAKNKALREVKIADQILTDEPFAGQAPLKIKADGPVFALEIDPQLAALADAFKIRVQVMQGSQTLNRGATTMRTTKGDFRGFKVNAVEKIENGVAVSEEIRVETPKKALIKTVNHVLETALKTDFQGFVAEIRNAGLEFFPVPVQAGANVFRCQIRALGNWGKPVTGELLLAGNSVGHISLGMPVDRMKNQLLASYILLKRKVLINDIYYDVYKILDQGNEPLLYVYEIDGRVWGLSLISAAFKTAKGIGIGSSLDQMRIHYPLVKLAYSEKKTPFVKVEDVNGIFIMQGDGEKKIISILIGNSPEFE